MIVDIDLKTGEQTVIEPVTPGDHSMAQKILGELYELHQKRERLRKFACDDDLHEESK